MTTTKCKIELVIPNKDVVCEYNIVNEIEKFVIELKTQPYRNLALNNQEFRNLLLENLPILRDEIQNKRSFSFLEIKNLIIEIKVIDSIKKFDRFRINKDNKEDENKNSDDEGFEECGSLNFDV
jgi:hypothetical protein